MHHLRCSAFVAVLIWTISPVQAQTASRVRNGFEVEFERAFAITSENSVLEIERYSGDVELRGTDSDQVVITETIYVKSGNEGEARKKASRLFSEIEETRGRIRVEGALRYGDNKSLHVELARGMRVVATTTNGDIAAFSIDSGIEVMSGNGDISVVNSSSFVKARSGNGDIDISDVAGKVTASSGAGDITIANVDAQVDVETGAGDIILTRVEGDAEAQTGGGDITVEEIVGNTDLQTAGGDIEAHQIAGSADLSTAGGSIEVTDVDGGLFAMTYGGDIEGNSIGGIISVETMAGDIELFDIQDDIVATSEVGNIVISVGDAGFLLTGTLELRAENGDVDLLLPSNTNANVSIDLGFDGEFDTQESPRVLRLRDISKQFRGGRLKRVKGILNSGGGRIEIRTGSGEVSIKASR